MKLSRSFFTVSILLLFISVYYSDAQAQNNEVDYEKVEITNPSGTTIYTENTKDIQGSPLLKDSFENGRVLFTSNKATKVFPINYDSHKNQVLFIEDNQIKVLNTNGVKGFLFEKPDNFMQSDKVQEVFTYQINDEALGFSEPTPVQVLYNQGTGLKLLALHKTNLMRGNSKDPYTGKVTDRYIKVTEYYLQKKNGDIEKLRRLRAKDIIKAVDKEHQRVLRSFMKENSFDDRSQKDLAKMLAYYDNNLADNS